MLTFRTRAQKEPRTEILSALTASEFPLGIIGEGDEASKHLLDIAATIRKQKHARLNVQALA